MYWNEKRWGSPCHSRRSSFPLGLSIALAAVLAVAIIADFPLQIWLLIVSIMMIRKRAAKAEMPVVA